MAHSSLITLTEVNTPSRIHTLMEKGWGHYAGGKGSGGGDDGAIAWKKEIWHRKEAFARKLTAVRYTRALANKPGPHVWSCNVLLKHVRTEKTLLVSVTHMPAHIQGHWKHPGTDEWKARKEAYTDSMHQWSDGVANQINRWSPDGVLVVADWNLNLKDQWVREYLGQHWNKKCGLRRAWTDFPTSGGSLEGNRIIDGSYYGGMEVTGEPELGARVRSSDHRPFKETFKIVGGVRHTGPTKFYDPATGHITKGKEWWGFGDYQYDEMFEKVRQTDEGTVVTFEFDEPPY